MNNGLFLVLPVNLPPPSQPSSSSLLPFGVFHWIVGLLQQATWRQLQVESPSFRGSGSPASGRRHAERPAAFQFTQQQNNPAARTRLRKTSFHSVLINTPESHTETDCLTGQRSAGPRRNSTNEQPEEEELFSLL